MSRDVKSFKLFTNTEFLIVVIAIFAILLLSSAKKNDKIIRIVRMTDYDNCRDRPLRPFHVKNRKISLASKNVYAVTGDGFNDKTMHSIEKVLINLTKCTDRSKTNCEHFRRMEWKSGTVICPLLESSVTPWASVTNAFRPKMKCPYNKMNFSLNMIPDIEAINRLNFVTDDYWLLQYEFYDENVSPWLCFHCEADFPRVRA